MEKAAKKKGIGAGHVVDTTRDNVSLPHQEALAGDMSDTPQPTLDNRRSARRPERPQRLGRDAEYRLQAGVLGHPKQRVEPSDMGWWSGTMGAHGAAGAH
jgi:hypothetical protein